MYLKASKHILSFDTKQNSDLDSELVSKFQIVLVRTLINIDFVSEKSNQKHVRQLWRLLEEMLTQRESTQLVDTCTQQLKETMMTAVSVINKEFVETKTTGMSYSDIERVNHLTKMIKDFVSLVEAD